MNAIVEHLTASGNQGDGINTGTGGLVRDCVVSSCGGGIDVSASTVRDCTVSYCTNYGISVAGGSVSGCTVVNSIWSGISVGGSSPPGALIMDNTCYGNNSANSSDNAGIYVYSSGNRIEGNHVSWNYNAGIYINSAYQNNVVIRNTVISTINGSNFAPLSLPWFPSHGPHYLYQRFHHQRQSVGKLLFLTATGAFYENFLEVCMLLLGSFHFGWAAGTIDPANKFAYGAMSAGWIGPATAPTARSSGSMSVRAASRVTSAGSTWAAARRPTASITRIWPPTILASTRTGWAICAAMPGAPISAGSTSRIPGRRKWT